MRSLPLGLFMLLAVGVSLHAQTNTFPSSGNVGIGKTPGLLLDVAGPIRSTSGSIDVRLQAGAAGAAGIGSFSNDPVLFFVAGLERMRLTTGGLVGIGTAAPSRKLDLSDSGSVYLRVGSTASYDAAIQLSSAGTDVYIGRMPTSGGGSGTMDFYNGGIRMVIAPSGNVGIGTIAPSHKLAVNGTIRAKEVIVDTGWADYVFAPDYRLAPLSEVEAHIKEHKRLPGMPSEATVATEGVSLGEVQTMLLAKIEELTLHQISQEKLLRAQQEEIRGLQTKLADFNSATSNANQDFVPDHRQ